MSDLNRRHFVKMSLFAAALFPFLGFLTSARAAKTEASAPPEGAKAVSESDPVATAIGYKADVANVDFAKYPQRKKPEAKNQFCNNCALYVPSNSDWGKCQMLTSGLVKGKGWCGSWNKKS